MDPLKVMRPRRPTHPGRHPTPRAASTFKRANNGGSDLRRLVQNDPDGPGDGMPGKSLTKRIKRLSALEIGNKRSSSVPASQAKTAVTRCAAVEGSIVADNPAGFSHSRDLECDLKRQITFFFLEERLNVPTRPQKRSLGNRAPCVEVNANINAERAAERSREALASAERNTPRQVQSNLRLSMNNST